MDENKLWLHLENEARWCVLLIEWSSPFQEWSFLPLPSNSKQDPRWGRSRCSLEISASENWVWTLVGPVLLGYTKSKREIERKQDWKGRTQLSFLFHSSCIWTGVERPGDTASCLLSSSCTSLPSSDGHLQHCRIPVRSLCLSGT